MDEELKQQIKQMRLQNMGYKLIARELGITRDKVRGYCKKMELTGVKGEIREAKPKPEKKYITCISCGKEVATNRKKKYCSVECRKRENKAVYKRKCSRCHKDFETTNGHAKYCSEDCRFIKTKCDGCGKEFRSRKEDGKFCSMKCISRSTRKSHEDYMVEFFNIHKGNIVPLELYQGSDNKLKAKCLHCGNEMNRIARNYIGNIGYGCQHCNNKSRGENEIAEWLDNHELEYQRQFSFPDLKYKQILFYDFAVINNGEVKALIEYDGEQHHKVIEFFGGEEKLKERTERDKLKDEYAKRNNIRLVRIRNKQTISKTLREFL